MMSRSKYLPGLSYGMSGGPPPLSWQSTPSNSDDEGPGIYTFKMEKGKEHLPSFEVEAGSYRTAEASARNHKEKVGATFYSFDNFRKKEGA